nr:S8 family peptidase [Longimicrobium terrae]
MVNDPNFPVRELRGFRWSTPRPDAPAVVTLDTGVVSEHPMLSAAILSRDSVVPGMPSAEDEHGHGTMMAGIALFDDVGHAAERNEAAGTHWLQSVKVIQTDGAGAAREENRPFWPAITRAAVELADAYDVRARVFALATTAPLWDPAAPTWWSHAVDRLAFAGGRGRVICTSIGNVDEVNPALVQGYPHLNLEHRLEDPAHAANALTIGAYTGKSEIPPDRLYAGARCVAPEGGVAPCTRAGLIHPRGDAIKPEVVFEGGNYVEDGGMVATDLDSLGSLTTGRRFLQSPLVTHRETSLATANAARFAAQLWEANPDLRPETIRGLVVHSASWTPQMVRQLPNRDERLALCGYGVPDFRFAASCARERATVVVEDRLPSAVRNETPGEPRFRRTMKLFRLPVPDGLLLDTPEAELRVTLSYFPEPNKLARTQYRGLDLRWEMQGPTETEDEFHSRVNVLSRGGAPRPRAGGGFPWMIGKQRRSKGTVQSDRWTGPGSYLAGSKWLAVYPVLGWWERRGLRYVEMPFSLIVTVRVGAGIDVYTPIETAINVEVQVPAI